jgi:urease accessory protein
LDQGKSLARVALQWLGDDDARKKQLLQQLQRGGHIGPVLGVVGALLGLDELQVCRLLGYCAARDIVSAAVRLSLVGPLASVRLLSHAQGAVQDGMNASLVAMQEHQNDPLSAATSCAPVLEALHPCHDLLQMRLFRT